MINARIKNRLARQSHLRKFVLGALRFFGKDIKIKHPYTNDLFTLHAYKHKGYWYYKKQREQSTMKSFAKIIKNGDIVVEVGGHIGFITLYFARLVGRKGRVFVFEPGSNNLPYLKKNIRNLDNVVLHEQCCSDIVGDIDFFEDNITGQNNSILSDYKGLDGVAKNHYSETERTKKTVRSVRLDSFLGNDFNIVKILKIDVEGAEIEVLRGMGDYLGVVPCLMVEVTENNKDVFSLLKMKKYNLFDAALEKELTRYEEVSGNTFALL